MSRWRRGNATIGAAFTLPLSRKRCRNGIVGANLDHEHANLPLVTTDVPDLQ
jgi:hypothetical protein